MIIKFLTALKSNVLFLLASVYLALPFTLSSQDSIRVDDIAKFSYPFDIEDGVLVGDGAAILTKALSNAHIVMLGNNSRNQQESDLDLAFSRVLNKNNYKALIMEIGPASGHIVNRLSGDNTQTVKTFESLNQQYHFEAGGNLFMPIPDFKYLGAAELLQYTNENNWSFAGIGVDSWVGFELLLDELYLNLSGANQQVHQHIYERSSDLLDSLYADIKGQSYDDVLRLTEGMKSSEDLSEFLDEMRSYKINSELVDQFQFSIDYWWMYGSKQGFEKNRLNSKRNKVLIKKSLERMNFDLAEDKLFLKMWRGHLTNGVTRNGFFGVGNMLMELAAYHGNTSLNIGVLDRFTITDGEVVDKLQNLAVYQQIHKPFIAQGQEEQWTLIDLRPFNEEFLWGNYIQTLMMEKMMRRFDMILIPKTDSKAIINY